MDRVTRRGRLRGPRPCRVGPTGGPGRGSGGRRWSGPGSGARRASCPGGSRSITASRSRPAGLSDPDNLVVLCVGCHVRLHREERIGPERSAWREWLAAGGLSSTAAAGWHLQGVRFVRTTTPPSRDPPLSEALRGAVRALTGPEALGVDPARVRPAWATRYNNRCDPPIPRPCTITCGCGPGGSSRCRRGPGAIVRLLIGGRPRGVRTRRIVWCWRARSVRPRGRRSGGRLGGGPSPGRSRLAWVWRSLAVELLSRESLEWAGYQVVEWRARRSSGVARGSARGCAAA